jgi:Suppressor of fused protein (SUFU)
MIVYMSSGMADLEMAVPSTLPKCNRRVELTTYAHEVTRTNSGVTDFIAWWLHDLAHFPFRTNSFFAPGQTVEVGTSLIPGSAMTGFYLANLPFADSVGLCQANQRAQGVLHVIPISAAELNLARTRGADALLEALGASEVSPIFELNRPSSV